MNNPLSPSKSSFGRLHLFVAVGVAALLVVGAAASALAWHTSKAPLKVHFSVLAHHSKRARSATVSGSRLLPSGATLAAVNKADGIESEIYVARLSNGEVCLTDIQAGKGGATACGRPAEVQENGVQVGTREPNTPTSVAVLVPDGTPSATVTDTNGSTQTQKAANNVIAVTDPGLASVTYTMPSGAKKVFRIPPKPIPSTSAPSTIVP